MPTDLEHLIPPIHEFLKLLGIRDNTVTVCHSYFKIKTAYWDDCIPALANNCLLCMDYYKAGMRKISGN